MGYKNRDHTQRRNISEKKFQRILNANLDSVGTAFIRRGRFYETEVASFEACIVDDNFVYARFPCKNTVSNRLNSYCVRFSLKDPVDFIRFQWFNKPAVVEDKEEEELF